VTSCGSEASAVHADAPAELQGVLRGGPWPVRCSRAVFGSNQRLGHWPLRSASTARSPTPLRPLRRRIGRSRRRRSSGRCANGERRGCRAQQERERARPHRWRADGRRASTHFPAKPGLRSIDRQRLTNAHTGRKRTTTKAGGSGVNRAGVSPEALWVSLCRDSGGDGNGLVACVGGGLEQSQSGFG
jgi:hypothetical protein